MPIKKSIIEKKWYYRILKVLFLIVPLLISVYLFFETKLGLLYIAGGLIAYYILLKIIWSLFLYIIFGGLENDMPNKNGTVAPNTIATGVQKTQGNSMGPLIVFVIIILVIALFISGNIKLPKVLPENTSTSTESTNKYGTACTGKNGKGLYGTDKHCYSCSEGTETTNPTSGNCSNGTAGVYCCGATNNSNTNANNDSSNSKCVPTGCGNYWYCSGYYYVGYEQIHVNGCLPYSAGKTYPSWSGTCRQCP